MEQRRWLAAAVFMCLLVLCSGRELKTKHAPTYDPALARIPAEYTSAVYTADLTRLFTWTCERCCDLTEGFEVIELIVDVKNCLQAYVGFARDMNAVIVVFRGTQENRTGSTCWPTKRRHVQQLSVAEMRMLRWICGHTRLDRVRNDDIRDRLGVAPIEEKLIQHRLRWFGHVQRRPLEAPVHCGVLSQDNNVRRGRGRPKLTWGDAIKRDLKEWDIPRYLCLNRSAWKTAIDNWIEDLFQKQLDLDYPGMPEAKVHSGFYSAYHNTTMRDGVVRGIKSTRELYGVLPIMVTGHSMGGAMASFCALDLVVNVGFKDVTLMTFGQPRIGNAIFASNFKRYLPNAIRMTNEHDIVPHLPPYYHYFPQKTYHHFPREVWIHNVGLGSLIIYSIEEICDDSGEDPTCSRSVSGNSVHDHIHYLGISMHAESWGHCRIVTDNRTLPHQYKMDPDGNIILSKQPGLSLKELHSAQ